MKKTIATIAITIAAFSTSAMSCQPIKTPIKVRHHAPATTVVVEQEITFEDVEAEPLPCWPGIAGDGNVRYPGQPECPSPPSGPTPAPLCIAEAGVVVEEAGMLPC